MLSATTRHVLLVSVLLPLPQLPVLLLLLLQHLVIQVSHGCQVVLKVKLLHVHQPWALPLCPVSLQDDCIWWGLSSSSSDR